MANHQPLTSTQALLSHLLGKPWRVDRVTPLPSSSGPRPLLGPVAPPPSKLPVKTIAPPHPILSPLAMAKVLPIYRLVNQLSDLTPNEVQLVQVMACSGFLVPATLARKTQQPLPVIKESLAILASAAFLLTDEGKVTLNVYAKEKLGLTPKP